MNIEDLKNKKSSNKKPSTNSPSLAHISKGSTAMETALNNTDQYFLLSGGADLTKG